jgi:hypothetical protein
MYVIFLAKDRHAAEPTWLRFVKLGTARGHRVQSYNKKTFLAGDLRHADVVCLKSYIDDDEVWRMIEAHAVPAVNARAACLVCGKRSRLDTILRNRGVRTPRSAVSAAETAGLRYPIVQKPNSLAAPRALRVLHQPPLEIDCARYFYQEMIAGDGRVHKAYCIGTQTFLVKELAADAPPRDGARRQAIPIPDRLAEAARNVGRLTGLTVYGADFVGSGDEMFLIDVNPFPSFRCLPHAADALWAYLEEIHVPDAAMR